MTIAALAEPTLMLAVFTVAIGAGSTTLAEMAKAAISQQWRFLAPSQVLAFAALFLVLIAETGRIPVDNPATHLELTMIHEAMILEYSGPYLALIEWSASIKQLLLMTLLINVFWPFGLPAGMVGCRRVAGLGWLMLKLLVLSCGIVLVETANAKMRLFRVPELMAVAFTWRAGPGIHVPVLRRTMNFLQNPEFGDKMVTLMAAFVLVLQIAMVGQRSLVMNIRHLRCAVVPAGRHRRRHRLVQSRAAHLHRGRHDSASKSHPGADRIWSAWWTASRSATRSSRSSTCRSPSSSPGGLTLVGVRRGESFYHPEAGDGQPGPQHAGGRDLRFPDRLFHDDQPPQGADPGAGAAVAGERRLPGGHLPDLRHAADRGTGGFFDVLVAVMVLGILVYRIRETFDSMDVSRLRRLRG